MLGTNTGRLRELAGQLCVGLATIIVVACAATTTMEPAGSQAESIADVRVEQEGTATVVTLLGLREPVFTAFAQQDPERVVVDLSSVSAASLSDVMSVHDGLVEEVSLSPYSTGTGDMMTRVEVTLTEPADYKVTQGPDGLRIRVETLGAGTMSDASDDVESDPWAMMPASNEAAGSDVGPALEATWSAEPATKLTAVEARQVGGGSLVHLRADGSIASAESFTLENPDRLVVDLPGLTTVVGTDRVDVGAPQAARVRIGQHADMVRIVIDGGEAADPFQGRRVMPAATGLVIALGTGQELDWAVEEAVGASPTLMAEAPMHEDAPLETAAAPAAADDDWMAEPLADAPEQDLPAAEAVPAEAPELAESAAPAADGGPVTIYGVEFDSQDGRDRVVVLGERPVDYLLYEPSPDTVIVSIQNAVIDPEAAVRIAPEQGGPVSLVTAFEQPDTNGTEVRVVVKRAPDLKPQISRRGSLVVIDFPRTGAVAATPPVMQADASQVATVATPAGMMASAASAPGQPAAGAMAVPAAALGGTGAAPMPASLDDPAAIDLLQEGGLMDGKQYTGRRISLDFKDIEMADVLRLVAEVSDLNVIAGDEVKGRVTIRLVDVPWDQALDVILLTKGLGFMRVGNVLRIAPSEILKKEEELRLQERRALEQLEDLVVKLQPVNYANVKDVKGMVARLLSSRGTVDVDKRTNTLIFKDIPSVVDEATALVKAIDTQTPQVLIEAKIVEASLDFSREFGTRWGFGAQPLTDAYDPSSAQRQDLGSDAFRLHNSEGSEFFGNNAQFINPLTAGPTALFNIAGYLLDDKLNLELQLQAAEVSGDGKVISSPRVVTLDNSKATIEQGVSIPFQTFENGDAQLEFVDAVLKLDVTPHITADKSIIMTVKVSRNAPDDSVFTLTGSPAIAKNQVDTETLVKDGQTLVIGGIYVIDKGERQSRVPFLHAIPLLGAAFRSDEISDSRKELLIFVTPRIVVTPAESAS